MVTVDDVKTGNAFEVLVTDRSLALDVFRHPFAYAGADGAMRGMSRASVSP